ncbi:MAG: amidohydrolase family protein [Oscillospiraceae bacterium]
MSQSKKQEFSLNEEGYKIIDAHCHIFPPKIEKKATENIGAFYGIEMDHHGSAEGLINSGKRINVLKYLVCSTATKPTQVQSINDFIIETCNKYSCFVGFGTLHPDYDNLEDEFKRIKSAGLKGLKLHPDFQCFNIDDKKAYKIYTLAQENNLPILFHTGDERYTFSDPKRLAKVMEDFKNLKVIAAHLGGYQQWDYSSEILKGFENVYVDCSSALFAMTPQRALSIINSFGTKRVLFGTDFPMWDHCQELGRFLSLDLTKSEKEDILYNNFLEFMK